MDSCPRYKNIQPVRSPKGENWLLLSAKDFRSWRKPYGLLKNPN
jgi:hypothetical protein